MNQEQDSRPSEAVALWSALPKQIGRLHLGDKPSSDDRYCGGSHEMPDGQPIYWQEGGGECPDEVEGFCLTCAIIEAESDASFCGTCAHPPASDGSGWIVGNGAGTCWRMWKLGNPVWTNDRDKAVRYARREDAEAVHAEDEDAWSVVPYSTAPASDEAAVEAVTQTDRDAAALFLEQNHANVREQVWNIRRGSRDNDPTVKAFAVHRRAAITAYKLARPVDGQTSPD